MTPGVRLIAIEVQAGPHNAAGDLVLPPPVVHGTLAGTIPGMVGNGPSR